jgi:hypothetical protein
LTEFDHIVTACFGNHVNPAFIGEELVSILFQQLLSGRGDDSKKDHLGFDVQAAVLSGCQRQQIRVLLPIAHLLLVADPETH